MQVSSGTLSASAMPFGCWFAFSSARVSDVAADKWVLALITFNVLPILLVDWSLQRDHQQQTAQQSHLCLAGEEPVATELPQSRGRADVLVSSQPDQHQPDADDDGLLQGDETEQEFREAGHVKWHVHVSYMRATGWLLACIILGSLALMQVCDFRLTQCCECGGVRPP